MVLRLVAFAVAVMTALSTLSVSAQRNRTDEVLAREAAYLQQFVHRFSDVVAEERYVQDAKTVPRARTRGTVVRSRLFTRHVELMSDFLLVKLKESNEWQAFRDVFEVNGEPVRDRDERLTKLFLNPTGSLLDDANAIALEGSRYNLGGAERTINNPLLVLAFLQAAYQPRFRFSLNTSDKDAGPGIWVLEYKEQTRPTLIRERSSGDVVAKGRIWIESESGRVVKTELAVSELDNIVTLFRFDERFQIAVPVEMREEFWTDSREHRRRGQLQPVPPVRRDHRRGVPGAGYPLTSSRPVGRGRSGARPRITAASTDPDARNGGMVRMSRRPCPGLPSLVSSSSRPLHTRPPSSGRCRSARESTSPSPSALALLVVLFESRLRETAVTRIFGSLLGCAIGLALARTIESGLFWADSGDRRVEFLHSFILIVLPYLGLVLGGKHGEWLEPARMIGLFRPPETVRRYKILDTSVIIDGRIADICETGFLDGTLVIPQFVLKELQLVADSGDALKRNRGRRGLDILQKIQKMSGVTVAISDVDFPDVREVDLKLIELARTLKGKIVTNDLNLNKVAQLRGIEVLNVNDLANSVKPIVLPGEVMKVFILKEGKEYNQGVAYLDDGTMVVIDNARRMIGRTIDIAVTSVLQTTAGKMIFGRSIESGMSTPVGQPVGVERDRVRSAGGASQQP